SGEACGAREAACRNRVARRLRTPEVNLPVRLRVLLRGGYMTVATVASRALAGIDAPEVTVEVHLGPGLPAFHIVGLPDTEVREARDRVRAALNHAHFEFPARRITVNLAPAELPKDSSRFDLPIALGSR